MKLSWKYWSLPIGIFHFFLPDQPDTSKEYPKQVLKSVFFIQEKYYYISQDKKQSFFSSSYFFSKMSRLLEVTRNTEKNLSNPYKILHRKSPLFWEDQDKYLTVCTNRWVPTAEYASPEGKDVGQCNLTFSLWDCNNIGLIIISQLLQGGLWNKVSHAQST